LGKSSNWFNDTFGFDEEIVKKDQTNEDAFQKTKAKARLSDNNTVLTFESPDKTFYIGEYTQFSISNTPPLPSGSQKLAYYSLIGDIQMFHNDYRLKGALFQAASQFNALEMVNPNITPLDGITMYIGDKTQGPACAIACAPALFYRNYLVNGTGQNTPENQIDGLKEAHKYLLDLHKQTHPSSVKDKLWDMTNGYCMPVDDDCLRIISELLAENKPAQRQEFKNRITYAVQWNTQVTGMREQTDRDKNTFTGSNLENLHTVAQIYCSSVPMPITNETNNPCYNTHLSINLSDWEPFITAIQEAIFEITYTAAIELFEKNGSTGRQKVFLTGVGCGVFCNPHTWSKNAITAMNVKFKDYPLDVYYVDFKGNEPFKQ
jgi:hypothetical protein